VLPQRADVGQSIWASSAQRTGYLLIAVALGATIAIPIMLGGRDALAATLHFPVHGYVAIFALLVVSWISRALKLRLLLRRLGSSPGFVHLLEISLATDFAFIATPAGIGGYAASLYYLHRAGTSTRSAASITAVDQGLDVLFFILALPIAGLALIHSAALNHLSTLALTTSALIAILATGAWLARRTLAKGLLESNALSRRWPKVRSIQLMVAGLLAKLRTDIHLILEAGPAFLFGIATLTFLQQLTRYGIFWLTLLILGHHVSFALTFLLQALVLQAAVWTGIPAGGGAAEIGLSSTLGMWVPNVSFATALLIWRAATLYVCLIVGGIATALLARRMPSTPRIDARHN